MNKDEKNISSGEGGANSVGTPSKAGNEKSTGGFVAFWNKLNTGLKATIIAAISLVIIIPILLVVLLPGNGNSGGPAGIGGGNQKTAYTVTVVTKGGMPMSGLPIYVYEYKGGSIGNVIDYATADENGKAVFSLSKSGSYAAKIDISIPEGYDVESFYPLVDKNMEIKISSSLIPESDLTGVTYNLGDIMRDFTVTTTEGTKFTLSEMLKTKKAVLINFWYDGCTWCETEFPLMVDAYEKFSDDLAIIALDPLDDMLTVRSFKSEFGLTFDVAVDTVGLATAFGIEGYPTSVMIDRYGVISMIEEGAITSERAFDVVFGHFTADDYNQKLIVNYNDIVPKEKPDVQMPSAEDMSAAFDKGTIKDIDYIPYPSDASEDEKEYSWPFLIGKIGEGDNAEDVIYASNSGKESSFAQLVIEVPLKAGEAIAFDYYSSSELGADLLYVVVDGKDIYSISGESDKWQTCYAYVAEEDATYEVGLVYTKDSSENVGDDTVYLKNLRVCTVDDVDSATYIYRFAATNPDRYGVYGDYVEIFFNEKDGYYHVDSADGPILLANLMGYTRFSSETTVYYMAVDYLAVAQGWYDDKQISESEFKEYQTKYDKLIQYCNYATNGSVYGVSPVTEELMNLLIEISLVNGALEEEKDTRWLELCCYYDSYGTDEELADPIKGLATFSAYDVVLSTTPLRTDKDGKVIFDNQNYPNSFIYDRVIMPRGLFAKFTPTQSGTYLISSYAPGETTGSFLDCEAWIFVDNALSDKEVWYTYTNLDRSNIGNTGDMSNVYMLAYLEAGRNYYINIAYSDVYQEGTIGYRVERLGGEGIYRFTLASPNFFTSLEDTAGGLTLTISGGIELELKDGYWREKRYDGRAGSILYADFTRPTGIFNQSIETLIELGAFNLSTDDNDEYILALLKSNQAYEFYLNLYLKDLWGSEYDAKYEEYKVADVLDGIYHGTEDKNGKPTVSEKDQYIIDLFEGIADDKNYNNNDNFLAFIKEYWGADSYEEYMETYQVEEVLDGIYHGEKDEDGNPLDYTDEMKTYLSKVIKAGYNSELKETISANDERIGCVMVDERLAELLTVIMDKYTFEGINYSWAKLCYYHQYFCAETPN